MSTSIKRLKQNGEEFVPITLSEAVVVNGKYIWNQDVCTTLDNVLRILYGKDANIEKRLDDINEALQQSPSNLIPGKGITITINDDGNTVISSDFSLYKIVETLPIASEDCLDKIYLVGNTEGNLSEYICVKNDSGYYFEEIGFVKVSEDIDTSDFVTKNIFDQKILGINQKITTIENTIKDLGSSIISNLTAEDIKDSINNTVSVDYEIPASLYDEIIDTDHIS